MGDVAPWSGDARPSGLFTFTNPSPNHTPLARSATSPCRSRCVRDDSWNKWSRRYHITEWTAWDKGIEWITGDEAQVGPSLIRSKFFDSTIDDYYLFRHKRVPISVNRLHGHDIQHRDIMTVQTIQGDWHRFVVKETTVVDSRIEQLQGRADLRLITCYPLDDRLR